MKLSKYVKTYDFEDLIGLYHPFAIKKSFVSPETFEKIKYGKEVKNQEKLRNQAMLVKNEEEDEILKDKIFSLAKKSRGITTGYWIITEECNLNCSYCFIPRKANTMSKETALNSVDTFYDLTKDKEKRMAIFYGGEPLLAPEVVKDTIKYMEEKFNGNIEYAINTNGTLLTPEISDFFKEYDVSIAVSLDGRKEEHNKLRDNYEDVIKGYELLKNGNLVSISCTIGEHNINNLPEIIDFFGEELEGDSIGLNLPICNSEGEFPGVSVSTEKLSKQLIEAYKVAREKGIYEDRMMRRVEAFVEEDFRVRDCGAYGEQVVFSPEGKIGPCHGFLHNREYFSDKFESEIFDEWSQRLTVNMDECKDCAAIALCGGSCAYSSKIQNGSIWLPDEIHCNFVNKTLDFLMEDLYKNIKDGKFENESEL